jgi:hypothetical protein
MPGFGPAPALFGWSNLVPARDAPCNGGGLRALGVA